MQTKARLWYYLAVIGPCNLDSVPWELEAEAEERADDRNITTTECDRL